MNQLHGCSNILPFIFLSMLVLNKYKNYVFIPTLIVLQSTKI